MTLSCPRCIGGFIYADDPRDAKTDYWCLMCGEWIPPSGYRPLPLIPKSDMDKFDEVPFVVDEHGDFIDIIDIKIESLIPQMPILTVSVVAKRVGCSNSEARATLERLVRIKTLEKFYYGPQQRWVGYRKSAVIHG